MKKLILVLCFSFALLSLTFADNPKLIQHGAISPDGSQFVFVYNFDLWLCSTQGGTAYPITYHPAKDFGPVWSDDGKFIYFSSNRDDNRNTYRIQFPNGEPVQITKSNRNASPSSFHNNILLLNYYKSPESWGEIFQMVVSTLNAPVQNGWDGGYQAVFSPNGEKIAYMKGHSGHRKLYRGPSNTQIWVKNADSPFGTTQLTEFSGADNFPQWLDNQNILFISDRNKKAEIFIKNINEPEHEAELFFSLKNQDVNFISTAKNDDKALIIADYNDFYILNTKDKSYEKIDVTLLGGDYHFSKNEIIKIDENILELETGYDGNLYLVSWGEILKKPKSFKGVENLTNTVQREKDIYMSPDSIHIAYTRIKNGFPHFEIKNLKSNEIIYSRISKEDPELYGFSPSGSKILFLDGKDIFQYNIENEKEKKLFSFNNGKQYWNSRFLNDEWIVTIENLYWNVNDLVLYNIEDDEFHKITYTAGWKRFVDITPDNEILFIDSGVLKKLPLTKPKAVFDEDIEDEDIEDEDKKDEEDKSKKDETADLNINFDNIRYRAETFINTDGDIYTAQLSPDKKTLIYSVRSENWKYSIWKTGLKGEDKNKIADRHLAYRWSKDSKNLFAMHDKRISEMSLDGKLEPISFSDELIFEKPELYEALFREAWLVLQNGFYDPEHHGFDWDKAYEKYLPYAANVKNNIDFQAVVQMLLSELSASHLGYWGIENEYDPENAKSSGYLGLIYDFSYTGKGYKVKEIILNGPCDIKGADINPGDYIVKINGESVNEKTTLGELLWRRIGRKTEITTAQSPNSKKTKSFFVKPVSQWQEKNLYYDHMVNKRKKYVEEKSGGKIAYFHIQAMNEPSYERFEQEFLSEIYNKKGIIIDVRDNGGGHTHDKVLELITKKPLMLSKGRWDDSYKTEPYGAFSGPAALLINQWSYSDAEIFPAIFKEAGRGTVIGVPTNGSVIGTGGRNLMDGSFVRMPFHGWYYKDKTNMENNPVQPDIFVENTPEDIYKNYDRQLNKAIEHILEDIE